MLGATLVSGTARRTKQYCTETQEFKGTVWHYDAQKLPNPYRATASEKAIRNRLHSEPAFEAMVCRIVKRILRTWDGGASFPGHETAPTIVIRCAFGKHRSVMVADEVAKRLRHQCPDDCEVTIMHLSTGVDNGNR